MEPRRSGLRARAPGLALAAVAAWTLACSGDGGPTGPDAATAIEGIAEAEIVAAADLADLTDDQRARVRAILRETAVRLAALRRAVHAGELDPEAAAGRARAIHAEAIEALSAILTREQIEHLFERLRDRRPPDRPDLDLTEEQAEAIEALRAELRATLEAIRADVRSGAISAEEGRALLREAWVRTHEAICAVLSEDQAAEVRYCSGDPPPGPVGAGPGGPGGPGPGGPPGG